MKDTGEKGDHGRAAQGLWHHLNLAGEHVQLIEERDQPYYRSRACCRSSSIFSSQLLQVAEVSGENWCILCFVTRSRPWINFNKINQIMPTQSIWSF